MKTGVWARSRSVLALAAGVAGQELKQKLGGSELAARIEQAKMIAETMGRLKGAFMKAGQLLSIDASDFLPPEAMEILSKLQSQAEPVDFAVLLDVLQKELGPERLADLSDLSPVPVASASIGQVHRATAYGKSVAVKIQYPGIAESIDSDLAILEKLGATALGFGRRHIDLHSTFEELKSVLHQEADYQHERASMDRYRGHVLASGDARFVVPESVPSLSTSRVLTMSWAEGLTLGAWIRSSPSQEEKQALAAAVLDLYCLEFFRWGFVQTDPNFGNFLVQPKHGNRIVLLDFGATLTYDEAFRQRYVTLLRAIGSGNSQQILEESFALGVLDPRENEAARALFVAMLESAILPFDPGLQPFVFGNANYAASSRDAVQSFIASLKYSPPPRALLFLHRKLGGIFQLLRRLDVSLDLRPYWEQMIAGSDSPAEA